MTNNNDDDDGMTQGLNDIVFIFLRCFSCSGTKIYRYLSRYSDVFASEGHTTARSSMFCMKDVFFMIETVYVEEPHGSDEMNAHENFTTCLDPPHPP